MINIEISEELRAFAEERARELGLKGASEYLETLLRQAKDQNGGHVVQPLPKPESLWDRIDEISASVPDEEWAKLPTDLAKNVDHYLYRAPKVE